MPSGHRVLRKQFDRRQMMALHLTPFALAFSSTKREPACRLFRDLSRLHPRDDIGDNGAEKRVVLAPRMDRIDPMNLLLARHGGLIHIQREARWRSSKRGESLEISLSASPVFCNSPNDAGFLLRF